MLRSLCILFFCFHWITCIAQSFAEKNFTRYTKLDGLSNNYVTDIVQDSTGYIWVATYEGLNRFDGSGFQSFLKSSNHNPIPDNTISSMQLFGNRLVIATDDGAQVISTKTLQQTNLFIPGSDALRYWSNACRYVCPDRQGNYLVSTKTGLYIFSPDGRIKKRYDYYTDKDIGNSWMLFGSRLYNLPDGNVMQLNSNGLLFFDRVKNNISDPQTLFPGLKKLLSIWREEKTIFFFISSTRVLVFNFKNNSFDIIDITTGKVTSLKASFDLHKEIGWQTRLTFLYNNQWALSSKRQGFFIATIDTVNNNVNCLPSKYLPNHMCNTVFADKQNRLWIGAEDGLYMQSLHPKIITTFEILNKTNEPSSITSLFLTENKIIAGTSKKQILILDKQSKQIIHSISLPHPPLENSVINQIIEIEPDTLWMAVSREIWWLNKMNFSYGKLELKKVSDSADFIRFLYLDKSNRVWIPVNSINTVYQYDRGTGDLKVISKKEHPLFKVNAINSIVEDKEGNIWISGDAAIKWNSKIQSIDTLIEYLPTQTNRKKGIIVMADLEGEIWAMLNDDGFARFTNKPTHIRPQNIRYTKIGSLLPTLLLDKIFIPVDDGVGYLDLSNNKGVIFKEKDGLPERAITTQYFVADPTNKSTWFACGNILCNLPLSPEQYYVKPPLLTISELSVINDTTIHFPGSLIRLHHNQNDIRLSFGAINFTDPENMRFAYRFKNEEDSGWVETGAQPNILFTNISPDDYTLELKVYAYDNKWIEQIKEIKIVVSPPFWNTTWFYLIGFSLVALAIYFVYRNRIGQIRQKANLDKLLAQTEMKALHSQMNPHFIFNCLNSIREMILNNENRQASHYLSKFAQLIRITLDNSTKPFISLKNTLDYLQRYLEMEKIRTDHFTYSIEVDEELQAEEIFLPPMLIQPFIENAIWHGQQLNKQMWLTIQFLIRQNELICIVEDDGIGIETSLKNKGVNNHHSVGIANIRHRIQLLNEKYDLKSAVLVEDKSVLHGKNETGTKVTLYLPLKNTEL